MPWLTSVGALYTARDARSATSRSLQTAGADLLLSTSTFRGSQNLTLSGFFLNTSNALDTGKSAAYGLQVDYPNDRWNAGFAYRTVQDHFQPALGFMTRTGGYHRYQSYLNFSPRPPSSRSVRRTGFTLDVDLETDSNNRWLTRLWQLTVLNVDLQSEDRFSVLVLPEYERLDRTFRVNVRENIALPRGGEYQFVRYRVTANTANRRLIAITPTIEWGGYYSGTRRQFSLDLTVRPRPGIILYASTELNKVDLPQTTFVTKLFRLTPELQFGQWISLVNTIQYDSVSAVLGWQSRFRWIVKPGDDVYFVYAHNWLDDAMLGRLTTLDHRATTKILYTQRF